MTGSVRMPRPPAGLAPGGVALWREVVGAHDLDVPEQVLLTEACRTKDRLDRLDLILTTGDVTWGQVDLPDGHRLTLELKATETIANNAAMTLKQILAALRLPDSRGRRPQRRGAARGVYVPGGRAPARRPIRPFSLSENGSHTPTGGPDA